MPARRVGRKKPPRDFGAELADEIATVVNAVSIHLVAICINNGGGGEGLIRFISSQGEAQTNGCAWDALTRVSFGNPTATVLHEEEDALLTLLAELAVSMTQARIASMLDQQQAGTRSDGWGTHRLRVCVA